MSVCVSVANLSSISDVHPDKQTKCTTPIPAYIVSAPFAAVPVHVLLGIPVMAACYQVFPVSAVWTPQSYPTWRPASGGAGQYYRHSGAVRGRAGRGRGRAGTDAPVTGWHASRQGHARPSPALSCRAALAHRPPPRAAAVTQLTRLRSFAGLWASACTRASCTR